MFREMRRSGQMLTIKECEEIMKRNTAGVLAVSGDDGYPYAVPLSYTYADGKIYIHSAKTGHKVDSILRNAKVSFCVVDKDEVAPEKYTTYFRSVIIFGKAKTLESDAEKRDMLEKLVEKYSSQYKEGSSREIERSLNSVLGIVIEIEHMTGKEAIELKRRRDQQK